MDTIACYAAGGGEVSSRASRGVSGDSPSLWAFRAATRCHAIDFDDYDAPSIGHPSAVLVPAILAVSRARKFSGMQAIEAFVAGVEAMDRMGEAVNPGHYERGFHASSTLGSLGAAVSAGRLLGLTHAQMEHAISIAMSAASGLKSQFGTSGKPLNLGFGAFHGVAAAQLAKGGATGSLDTVASFVELCGRGKAKFRPFGDPFAIDEYGLNVKLWPCCAYIHRILSVAQEVQDGLNLDNIEEIIVEMPPRNAAVARFGIPQTPDEARFSVPYCLAVALVDGYVSIWDFQPRKIKRAKILDLARKIRVEVSDSKQASADMDPESPDIVELHMKDDRVISRRADEVPGGPDKPATIKLLLAKFLTCSYASVPPEGLDQDRKTSLVTMLVCMRDIKNMRRMADWVDRIK